MSGLLSLKAGYVYGPVNSRRLGLSLGINALPTGRKMCSFDCAYCQYGWTDQAAFAACTPADFPAVDEVVAAVERALVELPQVPAYLTFSGHGEPTLHPAFGDLVDGINGLRDRFVPQAQTAILSNSSRVGNPAVRAALARLDQRIMKLDAGTEPVFDRFNRPVTRVRLAEIVANLRALGDVTLQSLFVAGTGGNTDAAEIDAWIEQVVAIAPRAVQVYTLARGYPSREIEPAPRETLATIVARIRATGIAAQAF